MGHQGRFAFATSGPRWTFVIEFMPICIHLFLGLIEKVGMLPFVIYRLLLGIVLIGLLV